MAKFINAEYVGAERMELQGTYEKIRKYINRGFFVKESRNGFWVLIKTAKINVTIEEDNCTLTFNMKEEICEHYGKKRISKKTFEQFLQDVERGGIEFNLIDKINYQILW